MGSNSRESVISVRELQLEDTKTIFIWRNSETIVNLASSQRKVTWEEHQRWVKDSLDNPFRKVFIIQAGNIPIGQIRFERVANEAYISIYLIDGYTGKGIGKKVLHSACDNIFEYWKDIDGIYSLVRSENEISQIFFVNQGFAPVDRTILGNHKTYSLRRQSREQQKNINFYTNLINQYDIDVKSLNWGSRESQELRFKILAEVANLSGKSVLDVGCGLGDFYNWLQKNGISVDYTGVDITPKMIEKARKRFSDIRFIIGTIDQLSDQDRYDYLFASGIFTYMREEEMHNIISRMFQKANYGIAFNALCGWADWQDQGELYSDPLKMITFCKTLSKKMIFRNDYHVADYTIYLYK